MTRLQIKQTMVLAAALLTLFHASCASNAEPEQGDAEDSGISHFSGIAYLGEESMPELVLGSQVIARVRFSAVEQTTEMLWYGSSTSNPTEFYAGALVITFDVKEYLKGSGGAQVRAILVDGDSRSRTEAEARTAAGDLLAFREKKYDDRDAIIFLAKAPLVPRTQQVTDLYYLAFLRAGGEHAYTVDSRWARAWLPDGDPPSTSGRAAGAPGDAQRFLTNVPAGGSGASVRSTGQVESMTLGALKTFIANLEAKVTAGGGTDQYRKCIIGKYRMEHEVEDRKAYLATQGRQYQQQFA